MFSLYIAIHSLYRMFSQGSLDFVFRARHRLWCLPLLVCVEMIIIFRILRHVMTWEIWTFSNFSKNFPRKFANIEYCFRVWIDKTIVKSLSLGFFHCASFFDVFDHVTVKFWQKWQKNKRAPPPGIEPGSQAWQACILTTILRRSCDLFQKVDDEDVWWTRCTTSEMWPFLLVGRCCSRQLTVSWDDCHGVDIGILRWLSRIIFDNRA